MTTVFADLALALGGAPIGALIVKVTATLLLALLVTRAARRSRAALRHVMLVAAFAALLILPVASWLAPARGVEVPARAATAAAAVPEAVLTIPVFVDGAPGAVTSPRWRAEVDLGATRLSVASLLWAAWAAGAVACLLPLAAGIVHPRALRRAGRRWHRGSALARTLLGRPVGSGATASRAVDVRLVDSIPGPMTFGLFAPVIVFPTDADRWTDAALSRAMIHELAHVRRGDWAVQCVARVVCALYWFHPLVWAAWHRLRLEAERACDDTVLRRADAGDAATYAEQLIGLAAQLSADRRHASVAMAAYRDLSLRVRAVLDATQERGSAGVLPVAAATLAAAALVTSVAPLRAVPQGQSPSPATAASTAAFDVTSVKANKSGNDERFTQFDGQGNFRAVNMQLRALIVFAYQIQPWQLDGGPDWISTDRFDIVARPAGAAGQPPDQAVQRQMLRALLAERFNLTVHRDTREMPIFELVLARPNGAPGPQLRPASVDCAKTMAAVRDGGPPPAPPGPGGCGVTMNPLQLRFGGLPLSAFTNSLSNIVQRVVVDRTGLAGNWEFELSYMRDPALWPPGVPLPDVDARPPSIFTALEEQLGLKLQAARGPVEVLVIDRVTRPTED